MNTASVFDTIVAPITGRTRAPVAVLRVSGPDSWKVAREVFRSLPSEALPNRSYFGVFANGDHGYLTLFEAGRSFTGEASAEMSIHGSPISVAQLLLACREAGSRDAEPGEFTQRAFLNGRIDLTQAEAVADVVNAETAAQLRNALRQESGHLKEDVRTLREEAIKLLAAVNAATDFSEEIGDLDRLAMASAVEALIEGHDRLLSLARQGRLLRHGLRVLIVGRPNVGKSSLFNALLGSERAIVTEVAGTTRDYLEERFDLDGVPCVLIDTAGLRESSDQVEQIGVARTRGLLESADVVLHVMDASVGERADDDVGAPPQALKIANKADLPGPGIPAALNVSAATGVGLGELRSSLLSFVGSIDFDAPMPNERHAALLEESRHTLAELGRAVSGDEPEDLLAVLLGNVVDSLGRITGETFGSDMLETIFRDFCIGK